MREGGEMDTEMKHETREMRGRVGVRELCNISKKIRM